jgi:sporulation-control protein spo0M
MSTFEQLLAAAGVGATQLALSLDSGVWPRGGHVTGKLKLAGGFVEQRIESLTVRLDEFITHGKSSEWKHRDEAVLASTFVSVPNKLDEIPFQLRVPDDARVSGSQVAKTWRVSVEADILWAVNPRAELAVEIVPHFEVTAVQRALERRGFTRTGVYIDFAMTESPDTVVVYYRAPGSLRDQIDGASLHLRVYGDNVFGRLILNRHQHGVGEHLMALVGGDREEHGFQILRSELLNDKGGPNSDAANLILDDILARALVLPGNADEKTLLRPAAGPPPNSDSLLRPADSSGSSSSADLLRPAHAPADTPTNTDSAS